MASCSAGRSRLIAAWVAAASAGVVTQTRFDRKTAVSAAWRVGPGSSHSEQPVKPRWPTPWRGHSEPADEGAWWWSPAAGSGDG